MGFKKPMSIITHQGSKSDSKLRKVFYFEDDKEKPILAAGVLFVRDDTNGRKEVLVQKVKKEDGSFVFSDFGGKVDLDDNTPIQAMARELGEEINYSIYSKNRKTFLDDEALKKILQKNIIQKIYLPVAKYFLIFAKFDDNLDIDMEKTGTKESHDNIERTVEWIRADQFIQNYFDQKLHPRLWSRQVLSFLGYEGPEPQLPNRTKVNVPKKFAFKAV